LRFWLVFANVNDPDGIFNRYQNEHKILHWKSSVVALFANILSLYGQTRLTNYNKTVVRLATIIGIVSIISMMASAEWFIVRSYSVIAGYDWKYIVLTNTVVAPIFQSLILLLGIIAWTRKLEELPQDRISVPRWGTFSWVVLFFLNLFAFIMFFVNAYQDSVKVEIKTALQPIFGIIVINFWTFFCLKKRTLLYIVISFATIMLLTLISQVGFVSWYITPDIHPDDENTKKLYDYYIISLAAGILAQILGLVVINFQSRRKAPTRRNTFDPKEFEILIEEFEEN